ncbi:MAG: DUF4870 domain-containing protein [Planctomycetota bacterium]
MSETPPQEPQPTTEANPTSSGSITDPPPVPGEMAPQEHRVMGMLCHLLALSGLIGIPFGNILGPLVLWLIKKQDIPFVDDQGKESLNFQITIILAGIVLGAISLVPFVGCITILALIALVVVALVFTIIASVKANSGEYYRYPFALRLIK